MSARLNNAAVSLQTRRFLCALLASGDLDEPCLRLLDLALARTREVHPGGLVFAMAEALGAERRGALDAGSFAEMFYATASFADDLQDGDAGAYMRAGRPLLINVLAQLLCATAARGAALAPSLGARAAAQVQEIAFRAGAAMLCGQRLEILREDWSVDRWREVAELSAGRQFEVYLHLAAAAARRDPGPLLALAMPLGVLLQMREDRRSRDPRLSLLPARGVCRLLRETQARLRAALGRVPSRARGPLLGLFGSLVGDAHGPGSAGRRRRSGCRRAVHPISEASVRRDLPCPKLERSRIRSSGQGGHPPRHR